jgi:hypothetical protein
MLKFSHPVLDFSFTGSVHCTSKIHEMIHMFGGFGICQIIREIFEGNMTRIIIEVFVGCSINASDKC